MNPIKAVCYLCCSAFLSVPLFAQTAHQNIESLDALLVQQKITLSDYESRLSGLANIADATDKGIYYKRLGEEFALTKEGRETGRAPEYLKLALRYSSNTVDRMQFHAWLGSVNSIAHGAAILSVSHYLTVIKLAKDDGSLYSVAPLPANASMLDDSELEVVSPKDNTGVVESDSPSPNSATKALLLQRHFESERIFSLAEGAKRQLVSKGRVGPRATDEMVEDHLNMIESMTNKIVKDATFTTELMKEIRVNYAADRLKYAPRKLKE